MTNPQRVKVSVTALMTNINHKIAAREAALLQQLEEHSRKRQAWFNAAEAALQDTLKLIHDGVEPEDLRYGKRGSNIHIDIDVEYPEEIDIENDRELQKMKRHWNLLELAVDPTIPIDPEGEYARYLS